MLVLLLAHGFTAALLYAQTADEDFIDDAAEADASGWMDRFETARSSPIDINRVSLEELEAFPLVSPLLARQVMENRKSRGPFLSWKNFISRVGLNDSYAAALEPYFKFSALNARTRLGAEIRARFIMDHPEPEGYRDGTYSGDPMHTYWRAKVRSGDRFDAGFLMEKDPGETNWTDHAVGFASFQNRSGSGRVIFGHFLVEAGQGLVLAGPYPNLKGANPLAPLEPHPLGARGYLAASEGRAFQGILVQKRLRPFHVLFFFSKTSRDGSVNTDGSIKSMACTGYHRTASETAGRGAFDENAAGLRIEASIRSARIGLTGFMNRYSRSVRHEETELYRFDFSGDGNAAAGCDWNAAWKNTTWTGEAAVARSGATALLSAWVMESKSTDAVLAFRRYDRAYDNPYASGFTASETQNETGLYAGFVVKPFRHVSAGVYADAFRKPWRTYFNPVPVHGEDMLVRMDVHFPRMFSVSARARFRLTEKMDAIAPDESSMLRERFDSRLRLEVRFKPFGRAESTTRLDWVRVRCPAMPAANAPENAETGFLFRQGLKTIRARRFQASAAWTIFRTASYDSRVYAYERDLDGVFSLPMFYGHGTKWHATFKWKSSGRTAISASAGRVVHDGVSFWGSGPERTAGNAENRLALQLDRSL